MYAINKLMFINLLYVNEILNHKYPNIGFEDWSYCYKLYGLLNEFTGNDLDDQAAIPIAEAMMVCIYTLYYYLIFIVVLLISLL